jgi:serine protease Do
MGAKINGISPRTPAEAAKLQPGDIILEFNHIPIDDDGQLVNVVSMTEVGATVPLLIFRNRETLTLQIQIHDRAKYPQ